MHAGDHCRRSAFLRETSDDGGGTAEAEAEAADLRGADGAHQTGCGQCLDATLWKRTVAIDGSGIRGNDFGTDFFECWSKTRGFWRHAHLATTPRPHVRRYGGNLS